MVSFPSLMRSRVNLVASMGDRILMSNPWVSWSLRYRVTFLISSTSWALSGSSQNTAGVSVALALETANLTQSWIGASLTWHILQISPCSTLWLIKLSPEGMLITLTVPAWGISKVLSWEPYSSAFWAISPTLGTVPMVVGSKAPCFLQKSMVAWYMSE